MSSRLHAAAFVLVTLSTALRVDAGPRPRSDGWIRMSATAYCLQGRTGSGVPTRRGVVAVDPRRIPLGSAIRVRGLRGVRDGIYAAADTGGAVKDNEIDVFIPDCSAAKAFGRQRVDVRIVRRGPETGAPLTASR